MENKVEKLNQNAARRSVRSQQEWNDSITDLHNLRLTKEDLAKKLSSRQSHNLPIAKAELMERNRQPSNSHSFSPSLSARLRASDSKTVDEALSEGSAAIALAQKIRNNDISEKLGEVGNFFVRRSQAENGLLQQKLYNFKFQDERSIDRGSKNLSQQKQDDHINDFLVDDDDTDKEKTNNEVSVVQKRNCLDLEKDKINSYPLSPQGWQNLNNTIQLVVKTCEALWQQLEEERMTRQRLHFQLQEQRSVITTLTAELLQIQEHQELILRELQALQSGPSHSSPRLFSESYQPQQVSRPGYHQAFKGLSASRLLADRAGVIPRTHAFSDSSIDSRPFRKKSGDPEGSDFLSRPYPSSDYPYRLSHQGKSKSVTQLNRDEDEEEQPFRDAICHKPRGDFIHESSVVDLLRNYKLSDG